MEATVILCEDDQTIKKIGEKEIKPALERKVINLERISERENES